MDSKSKLSAFFEDDETSYAVRYLHICRITATEKKDPIAKAS
jgi:hypothetical protein